LPARLVAVEGGCMFYLCFIFIFNDSVRPIRIQHLPDRKTDPRKICRVDITDPKPNFFRVTGWLERNHGGFSAKPKNTSSV